ncbi:DNA/RNA non-specific endonuclease [Microcoleus sp. D2_18a_D3]|uniref:DNA/RNA non-specific endonuclease n=1 Tax=Microcoleus sp. D2_18a_D3 TaxID=3055330 RepID=UPI00403F238E
MVQSPPRPNDYIRSGYNRGHIAASADCTRNQANNHTTFLTLLCHFREKIIWKAYSIRLLPKILIWAILLENKRSNARYIYS